MGFKLERLIKAIQIILRVPESTVHGPGLPFVAADLLKLPFKVEP